jgi:ABC-type nickel/cobalt efflux system permease component RcnA
MFSKRSALLGLVAAAASGILLADPAMAQGTPTSAQVQAAAQALSSGTSFGMVEDPAASLFVQRRHHRRHHRRRHHRRHHWRHHRRHHGRHHGRHHSHHSNSNVNRNRNTNTNTNVNRISINNENVNIDD